MGSRVLADEHFFEVLFTAIVPDLAQPFHQLQWSALSLVDGTASEKFAISDRGADILWAGPYGPPNQESLVLMPVSKNVILVGAMDVNEAARVIVHPRHVNAMMHHAHEFVFSTDKLEYEELEKVADMIGEHSVLWAAHKERRVQIWTPYGLV